LSANNLEYISSATDAAHNRDYGVSERSESFRRVPSDVESYRPTPASHVLIQTSSKPSLYTQDIA